MSDSSLDDKLLALFPGKVVRKDLTQSIKQGANVPIFVLEYLLGMYCSTNDEATIKEGIDNVKKILSENYVRPDEKEKVKMQIRENGSYKIIDRLTASLNDKLRKKYNLKLPDAIIAATSKVNSLIFITNDKDLFKIEDINIFNLKFLFK